MSLKPFKVLNTPDLLYLSELLVDKTRVYRLFPKKEGSTL